MLFFVQLIFSTHTTGVCPDGSFDCGTAQATFDLLVSPATCLQLVADDFLLIAIDLRFELSVIATGLFPRLASLVSKGSKASVAAPTRVPYIAMLLDLSVFAQRDEGPNRGTTPRRGQGVENCLPPPPPRDLGQQRRSDSTLGATGGLMDPHMQFAPSPPFGPAVLTDFPLALTVDQAGRIYHQVHRFIGALGRQHHRQFPWRRDKVE